MKTFNKANNKKLVAGIITLFSAAAVVSTGFASWVITAGDTKTAAGSITVDTVSDNAHTMSDVTWDSTNGNVYFGAPATMSTAGAWLTNDTGKAEVLTVTATFTVTNATDNSVFDSITLAENASGTKYSSAASAKYVAALPTWNSSNTADTAAPCIYTTYSAGTYTIGIKFKWGEHFGSVNPYNYYNAHAASDILTGTTTYAQDAKTSLEALEALNSTAYTLTIVTQ